MEHKITALVIFIAAYLLFITLPARRMWIAIIGSLALILLNVMSPNEAFWSINWNVMGMFVGMLLLVDVFMGSKVPAYLAELIVDRSRSTAWSIIFICIMTSFISAFVENVATVLIVAPIAIELARKLKINPTEMIIAIAISSNLQGTATLIGDPPSMLLGGFAKMNFNDFFFYHGKPGIFWAVQLGAAASMIVLYFFFRRHKEKTALVRVEKVRSWLPAGLLVGLILLLATSAWWDQGFTYTAGSLCMVFGLAALAWAQIVNRHSLLKSVKDLDWETTLFLAGVFVMVGSLTSTGWISASSDFLSGLIGGNIFLGYTAIVFISVVLSAFIDNVPFLVAMLPVASGIAQRAQVDPSLFLFGLLIGASLGGNITPIGASANIVACGILKKEGYPVTFGKFVSIGLPFTLAAVSAAYLFIWLIWH